MSFYVGVSNEGNIFFDRFRGWLRIGATVLGDVLRQGCWTNAASEPKPATSVRFVVAPRAPQEKINAVFSILEKNGWTREKVIVEPWNSHIRKISGNFYIDKLTQSAQPDSLPVRTAAKWLLARIIPMNCLGVISGSLARILPSAL